MKNIAIDKLPLPVLLISKSRKIIDANEKARVLFKGLSLDKDISTVIRNPDFLESCAQVFETQLDQECDFIKTGRRRRTFKAIISTAQMDKELGAFIALYETTITSDAERMRSSFVADVSHELRSPLTTLVATIETLRGKAGGDEAVRTRFINLMAHETGRMHRIVNDLLSLSATEAQEHILPNDNVNLGAMVTDITNVLGEKARQKNMTFVKTIESKLPDTRGDYDELYQVIHNLIDNALKYGLEDTEVKVEAKTSNNLVQVSINNIGNVIPGEHIPRLTERFYRVDKSRSREMGGTGLGLAIVKHIVNRHMGNINIKSTEKEGTTFSVSFPIKNT